MPTADIIVFVKMKSPVDDPDQSLKITWYKSQLCARTKYVRESSIIHEKVAMSMSFQS
jgi:hypothetical protein